MSQQVSQSGKCWLRGEYITFNAFNSVCAPVAAGSGKLGGEVYGP